MRLNVMRLAAASCLLLAAAACSTFGPTGQQQVDPEGAAGAGRSGSEASYSPFNWSPPNYAGLTAGRIVYPGESGPIVAEFLSGKEAEDANVSFATPDGNVVTYSTKGLKAFEGQLARAEVEKALADRLAGMWETLGPEIRGGIVDAICAGMTGGACAVVGGL